MLCPFGKMIKNDMEQFNMLISCLTEREKEYIRGIRWERNIMYHRLNSRMFEIGVQLAVNSEFNIKFYFFKEKKILCFNEQ